MASTVPAKSNNPLHNFDLPHLKWKKNHHSTTNNNHQRRRSSSSAADSSPSPSPSKSPIPPHSIRSPIPGDDSSVIEDQRHNNNDKVLEIEDTGKKESRSKILLKLPRKNNNEESQEENKFIDEHQDKGKAVAAAADEESAEMMSKTWNLRPRKPIHKSLNVNGVVPFRSTEGKPQSPRTNGNRAEAAESNAAEKKEKRQRFSISLSREEIEEDIFSMTGLKAARRPKKRVKAVQKQLDNLFPGLWLASVTADSYKVSENHPKS